ncbi:hypothetical protein SBF1_2820007 [Candidatus Desulfosporosinus infrequens]|uniref:Uncharacterized protein n=1 Tax=Candidatus Desulfosporosinus infrequens TaxID=2043169 RepID=A0A2U3KUJ6_9FIRM|nr:hypothetical protein SBF1_2820007 [Candidatus Desulfosporosinus infrequens]
MIWIFLIKGEGKWDAQVTIGYDPKTGRPKYKMVLCKSQPAAKRTQKELLRESEEGIDLQGQANAGKLDYYMDESIQEKRYRVNHLGKQPSADQHSYHS